MICQVIFSDKSKIVTAKYSNGMIIAQHEEKTLFSILKMGKATSSSVSPQFVQLNLLKIASLSDQLPNQIFDFDAHKLPKGQSRISLRHITRNGVVRDFVKVLDDNTKLYSHLLSLNMVEPLPLSHQVFANSQSLYNCS